MLNIRQTQIIAGTLGALLALDFLAWTLPSPRACIEKEKRSEASDAEHKQNSYGPITVINCAGQMVNDGGVLVTALATVAIAWFTLSLRDVSREQGRITNEQLRLAREEFIASHRPRLRVRAMQTDGLGGASFITIANVGESAATITGIVGIFRVQRDRVWITGSPDLSKANTPHESVRKFHPGGRHTYLMSMTEPSEPVLKEIMEGRLVIYAAGTIIYADDIGTERCTGFCWAYDPQLREFVDPALPRETEYNYED